jgi:RimJ/RimL family protein N-acetyltransferase
MVSSADIVVREALPDDAQKIGDIIQQANTAGAPHAAGVVCEYPTPHDPAHVQHLTDVPTSIMLVAEELVQGTLVGVLILEGYPHITRNHNARMGFACVPHIEATDIVARLVKEAVRWASRNPTLRRLEQQLPITDTQNHALLSAAGFVEEGRARGALRQAHHYIDVVYLARKVDKPPQTGPLPPLVRQMIENAGEDTARDVSPPAAKATDTQQVKAVSDDAPTQT